MKKYKGMTLVEIMIVVGIIAILAALAIPNLLRSRLDANESCAMYSLQTLRNCSSSYRGVNSTYPSNLKDLGTGQTPYIDAVLTTGEKQGYTFTLTGGEYTFTATARPKAFGFSGKRSFFVNESGVLRYTNQDTVPIATDPPVD